MRFFDADWGPGSALGEKDCKNCPFFDAPCDQDCTLRNFLPGGFGFHWHMRKVQSKRSWRDRAPGSVADQLLAEMLAGASAKLELLGQTV